VAFLAATKDRNYLCDKINTFLAVWKIKKIIKKTLIFRPK
jgi:hypothetical protein